MNHRTFAILIALTAMTPQAAGATDPAPAPASAPAETTASAQARRFLDALTTTDDAGLLAFVHQAIPKTTNTDAQWLELRSNLRQLKYHGLLAATPTTAELSVFDEGRGAWARFLVTVAADPPYAVTSFGVRQGRRPADVPPPPKLQPPALIAATKAWIAPRVAADMFSGVVLIAKDGKPIFTGVYGLADRAAMAPITADSQFRYGSMGKMLTAVSIMQLVQAGKVDLKAPLGRYLPDYPNRDIADKVTVENLITHTGGTGDIFGPQFTANRLTLKDPKDYVALYGARAPQFAPGTAQAYSNYGFILLGRIVEAASGQSFEDYVGQHIYRPAGMTSSGMAPETTRLPRRATGYMVDHDQLKSAADTQPWRGTPAGGGYSTVGDFLKFANALKAGRLLDAEHLKALSTGAIVGPDGTRFRYDFGGVTGEGLPFLGHAGGAPGMNGELRIFDSGYTVVVLANRDPPAATGAAAFISDRLP